MILVTAALATAPFDADGEWVHVATLPVFTLHSPNLVQRTLQITATSDGPDGGLWVLHGFGEVIRIAPDGAFGREPWRHVQLNTMGVQGDFVVRDGALTYYEMPHGVKQADLTTGAITDALAPVDPPGLHGLSRIGGTWWLENLQLGTVRSFTGSSWGEPAPIEKLRNEKVLKAPLKVSPCGELDGKPITSWYDYSERKVGLSFVTPELVVGKTVWSAPLDFDAWPAARDFENVHSCQKLGDLVQMGQDRQVFVFRGDKIVSAIRAGAPQSERFPEYGAVGDYAFDNLLASRLLGDGRVLVTVDRKSVIKVFARDKGGKKGDALSKLQAGAKGAERFAALWDLGWWERLEEDARTAGDTAWQARARARQLVYWASSGPPGETYMGPGRMEKLDEKFLAEIDTALSANPKEPWLLYVRALLLQRLERATDATSALVALEAALPGVDLTVADVPQLFDLAASRGDLAAMKRMHDGVDAASDPRTHALWAARIARVEGQPSDALAILKALDRDRDAMILKARLLADSGELDQSIATWMQVVGMGPADDPTVQGGLGVAYLRRGLVELAVEALVKAVNGDPGTAAHKSNLAAALAAQDQKSDALKQLYAALGEAPEDPLLQHQLQDAMGKSGGAGSGGDVAVLPFDVAGGSVERVGLGDMLASMASTGLVGAGVGVVERSRLDAVFAEQDLQRTSRVDPTTAVQMGKVIGAAWLITGSVAEFEGQLVFDVRRIDVKSGKVVAAERASAPVELEPLQAALDAALVKVRP